MQFPMSMSIIIVDLGDGFPPEAMVVVRSKDSDITQIRSRVELGDLSDATDPQMWAQMAAARVCDAL